MLSDVKILGYAEHVEEQALDEETYTFIEGVQNPFSCTVLVKGAHKHVLEQIKDAVRDGLRAVSNAMTDGFLVQGAGTPTPTPSPAPTPTPTPTPTPAPTPYPTPYPSPPPLPRRFRDHGACRAARVQGQGDRPRQARRTGPRPRKP